DAESLRRQRGSPLKQAAEAYVVRRGEGLSVIAGYPWFADWGRDTFISLRGLCLAAKRLEEARRVLLGWSKTLYRGLAPNRFPDDGGAPEYTSVDASLWLCVAIYEFLEAADADGFALAAPDRAALERAVQDVVSGYAAGSLHGIGTDQDGLLRCGTPDTSLTWMDARVDGRPVTGRAGKPVEVQALWINALRIAGLKDPSWETLRAKAQGSFAEKFWNAEKGCLYDVVDVEGVPGKTDARVRPNQIFAVGGLPWAVLSGERAQAVTDLAEQKLWTPLGLRTLAPEEPGYCPRYEGGASERDRAYHQGTAWPWLLGAFVEAWVRVRNGSKDAKLRARQKFLAPLLRHLDDAGLGHVSEIADASAPFAPRGCPFQAWSVGEALRLDLSVLAPGERRTPQKENLSCKSES
ncbi:MAG: glycogen debranching protein, partial [Elusimicrobia bacterium]|nr:glycogen debranching protein [Elusimicrobiota bacterium]